MRRRKFDFDEANAPMIWQWELAVLGVAVALATLAVLLIATFVQIFVVSALNNVFATLGGAVQFHFSVLSIWPGWLALDVVFSAKLYFAFRRFLLPRILGGNC